MENDAITLVKEGKVDTVYISYKDRLTRFGFGYFDYIFNLFGTKIEVINLTKEKHLQPWNLILAIIPMIYQ